METGQNGKLIVAGGLLILAIVLYVTLSSPEDEMPGSPEAGTAWYCTACQKAFDVSAAEASDSIRTGVASGAGEDESEAAPTARGRGRRAFALASLRIWRQGQFPGLRVGLGAGKAS